MFLHGMKHDVLALNEMVLVFYQHHAPKIYTFVQFEEFI
jgi:hypothetical protein